MRRLSLVGGVEGSLMTCLGYTILELGGYRKGLGV